LDYRWPVTQDWREAVLPGLAVLGIFSASVLALVRWPRIGFLAFSFFVILAPTSSFNPIADLAVDHRMYLPLALLIVLGLLGFCGVIRGILRPHRRRIPIYVVAVVVLAALWTWRTFSHNLLFTKPDAVWQNVLHHAPDNARAYNNLGGSRYLAGDFDGALRMFRRAIELQPNAPEAYSNSVRVLLRKGDLPGAIAILRQGVAAAPRSEMLHGDLGFLLDCQGKTGEAEVQYRLALNCNPRFSQSHFHLGRLLERRGAMEEAIPHLKAALQSNPMDVPCSFWLALAYQRCGRFPQAIGQYRRTLELAPKLGQAQRNLERCREGNRVGEMLPDKAKKAKVITLPR
jgi:Flp pilus assembly protein TadD